MSAFAVLVAVDFGSGKVNYELCFPGRPTIPQLRDRIQFDIGAEAAAHRADQPFEIYRAQVFDERLQMWVDLMSAGQLEHYCQIYVFQREQPGSQRDRPGRIPPPIRPPVGGEPAYAPSSFHYGSELPYAPSLGGSVPRDPTLSLPPQPARSLTPQAAAESKFPDTAAPQDKARIVFAQLHPEQRVSGKGLSKADWSAALARLRLMGADAAFSEATCDELFDKADRNSDGVVSMPEWLHFAPVYPKLLDSMYYRSRDMFISEARAREIAQAQEREASLEQALVDAREAVEQAGTEAEAAAARVDEKERELGEVREREVEACRQRDEVGPRKADAQQALVSARKEQAARKESARQYEQERRAAARQAELAEKRVQQREDERERAAKELERLEKMIEATRDDLRRRSDEVEKAVMEAEEARRVAEQVDPAIEDQLRQAEDDVLRAEEGVREVLGDERQLTAEMQEAQKMTAHVAKERALAEKDVQQLRQREQQRRQQVERTEADLEGQRKRKETLESAEHSEEGKRESHLRDENELLQLEVRLQEQKDAMAAKEEHLRNAHRSFCESAGRASPQRAISTRA